MKESERYLDTLSSWYIKFKRYTVAYKKGAFHLHNLFNSPKTSVESFDKLPFCTHDRFKQMIYSDTLFLKSKLYYYELEEGFWVFVSSLNFKKNVLMENLYDKRIPLEYHFINIHIKVKKVVNKSLINGLILRDKTWSMFKAGHAITEYHFKNSDEKNITLFFTSKWLEKQMTTDAIFKSSSLKDFFNSTNTYMILNEDSHIYEKIHNDLTKLGDQGFGSKNNVEVKKCSLKIFKKFINKIDTEINSDKHFELNDSDRKNIQRAEQFMSDNVVGNFPGIVKIARKVGISPTKLKNDFKSVHNTSLYKYYSAQKMQAAYQLIIEKNRTIKQVANLLGYENVSKFSSVFKKYYQMQPSSVNKE